MRRLERMHREALELERQAERERIAPQPKLSNAEVSIYAKEHGITYGKAVQELEGRRET